GFIAMDVSRSLNPLNEPIPGIAEEKMWAAFGGRDRRFFNDFRPLLLDWTEGKWVRGLILIDHHIRLAPFGVWLPLTRTTMFELVPFNERRRRQAMDFFDQLSKGTGTPAE